MQATYQKNKSPILLRMDREIYGLLTLDLIVIAVAVSFGLRGMVP